MNAALSILSGLVLLLFANVAVGYEMHWGYEGQWDPAHWGDIEPAFATCKTGKHQSPINITNAKQAELPALAFDYRAAPTELLNNGHTIQLNVGDGSYLHAGGKRYRLMQLHFHAPSENQIAGKSYALEAHFVHMDPAGSIAVVAVLFDIGADNFELLPLWSRLPQKPGTKSLSFEFDAARLLPMDRHYFAFESSLTTPPCSEGVAWFVLKAPLSLSLVQLTSFQKLYRHNARPLQAPNGRVISESK